MSIKGPTNKETGESSGGSTTASDSEYGSLSESEPSSISSLSDSSPSPSQLPEPAQWEKAKLYFKKNPKATKLKRDDVEFQNSFIKVNGVIYALAVHEYLGKGANGKVKLATTEEGEKYAVKIEGIVESAKSDNNALTIGRSNESIMTLSLTRCAYIAAPRTHLHGNFTI